MSVITPNMNLIESTVNVDSGLSWEQNLNSSLTIIDQHNHSSGNGVAVGPTGLNINSDLTFQNNQAINLKATIYTEQSSLASLLSIYFKTDGNAYVNDGAGNVIQLTVGGAVNATASGISSGSATASFVSSVLVVNAASNTPANIQCASILLGNNIAASKFLTVAPPPSLASNYTITLPTIPSSNGNFMTMDTGGNISTSLSLDNITLQISSGSPTIQVKPNSIGPSQLTARTTGTAIGNFSVSVSDSGSFTTTSSTYVQVTNLSCNLNTSGSPVFVCLTSSVASGIGAFSVLANGATSSGNFAEFAIFRDATMIAQTFLSFQTEIPPSFYAIDFIPSGNYTYTLKAKLQGTGFANVFNCNLMAYELYG